MSEVVELRAELRSDIGKGASRRLRRDANGVPAIVYGGGKDPVNLTFAHNKVIKALESEAFYSSILTVDVAGKKEKVVLKAVQRHPSKARIQHMDFLRVTGKEQITMQVPLHFMGEEDAPGVKAGGLISKTMTELEVKCLPKDLPEFIEVDMSALEIDHALHLSDIKLPSGVVMTTDLEDASHDSPIISIHTPKKEEEEVPAEAAGEEASAAEDGEEKKDEE